MRRGLPPGNGGGRFSAPLFSVPGRGYGEDARPVSPREGRAAELCGRCPGKSGPCPRGMARLARACGASGQGEVRRAPGKARAGEA